MTNVTVTTTHPGNRAPAGPPSLTYLTAVVRQANRERVALAEAAGRHPAACPVVAGKR